MLNSVTVDGDSLSLEQFHEVAVAGAPVSLPPPVLERVAASRAMTERLLQSGKVIYGITTGFGKFSDRVVPVEHAQQLQRNLILSHAVGVGEPLPTEIVRGMILLRLNSLAKGYSGVRGAVLHLLAQLLNKGITPVIPSKGSIGASGDLAPLAHLALALIGEGMVEYGGGRTPARDALAREELSPLILSSKEGIALINGTQLMLSRLALACFRGRTLVKNADLVSAMSLEAGMCTDTFLHPNLAKVRPHPGIDATAANLRAMVKGSGLIASHKDCPRVQDSYSFRCIPQVHGPVKEALRRALEVVSIELNSATDNPLIFPEESLVLSGGNFHGHPLSLQSDFLKIALTSLCTISERRMDQILSPLNASVQPSSGLPPFLSFRPGIDSGMMLLQYTAASLLAENRALSHPASVDSIPTSANQEDVNTMGATSTHLLLQVLENTQTVLALELLVAAGALEHRRSLTFGEGTEIAFQTVREKIPPLREDRIMQEDIHNAIHLVRDGSLVREVEAALGPLLI